VTARTFATLLAGAIILALAPAASAQPAKDDDALEKLVKARGGFSFIKRDETQAGKPVIEVYINARPTPIWPRWRGTRPSRR
jgi:hypothetical protein